jgi:hypothetical protein
LIAVLLQGLSDGPVARHQLLDQWGVELGKEICGVLLLMVMDKRRREQNWIARLADAALPNAATTAATSCRACIAFALSSAG